MLWICWWWIPSEHPWGPNKGMGPKQKGIKKEVILSTNDDLGRLTRFTENICSGAIFWKINWFYSSWDGALAFKKNRGPTWRPKDQFWGICWWSEFPIFTKNMKIDFPHAVQDQTRPKFEGIASYGPRHAPAHPQTSQIQFKIVKKSVFVTKLNFQCLRSFCCFWALWDPFLAL